MDGLLIGFDLCDTYTQVCVYDEETAEPIVIPLSDPEVAQFGDIPTVVCKCRRRDEWRIGSDGFKTALESDGIMVDKLIRLSRKSGVATLEDVTYQASELLEIFILKVLGYVSEKFDHAPIRCITFTLRVLDARIIECILATTKKFGLSDDQVQIIGHAEAYMYFLMSQKPEVYANIASLFELSEEGLTYMECRVMRGMKPQIVRISAERLEEGFDLGILENAQGKRLADNIICSCAERLLAKKIISSVCLAGKGFEHVDQWGVKALPVICNRRKAFYEGPLFAKGAVYLAMDTQRESTAYPYMCVCDGRLASNVSINMQVNGLSRPVMLVSAGTRWYQAGSELEFYIDDMDSVDLTIQAIDQMQSRTVKVDLDNFPVRPKRATRVKMSLSCPSESLLKLKIEDMGFGTMFPASDACVEREIPL
ncbi:MAG: hypothetical protein J5757_01885 [Lachnospiraceae bacterium]|nr:hypothetical protein [Lachnospiraceae bacterium]